MKFINKYPDAISGDIVENDLLVSMKSDNCSVCGELTKFIDIDFEAYVCSNECRDKLLFDWAIHSAHIHNKRINKEDF